MVGRNRIRCAVRGLGNVDGRDLQRCLFDRQRAGGIGDLIVAGGVGLAGGRDGIVAGVDSTLRRTAIDQRTRQGICCGIVCNETGIVHAVVGRNRIGCAVIELGN